MQNSKKFFIVTFYKCFSFEQIQLLENLLKRQFKKLKIVGTVILTPEGINSTIASQNLISLKKGIALIEKYCGNLEIKNSISDKQPFKKLKIKSRQEIVPSGINLRIENHQGKYVDPEDWHDFISHNDVQTIDVRNEYEIEVGTFKNSISPNTKNFREFPPLGPLFEHSSLAIPQWATTILEFLPSLVRNIFIWVWVAF